MATWLAAAWRDFRWADALDIFLFAGVLYVSFVVARHVAKRRLRWALAGLGGVYFASRALDLYLMTLVFQGLWAVLLVGLLIVFQDDLRRFMRRASARGVWPWGPGEPRTSEAELDVLAETAFSLARQRVGALIVVVGHEPLDHLEGGTPLEGRISGPLLQSIFDPHSAGHDGAALVERGRVTRFGVHLPLSQNPHHLGRLGTRHSSGLGLSERSDALVLIVSEERGTVTLAQSGELVPLPSAEALRERLTAHQRQRSQAPLPRLGPRLRDGRTAVLALALAVAAWLLLAYRPGLVERSFAAPIEYDRLPAGVIVDPSGPVQAEVTLEGTAAAFALFDARDLRVHVDAGAAAAGGAADVRLKEENVERPSDLRVARIEPSAIHLRFERAR
jgi:DNA integrity scanning protein DisA with diadenylate cyclase activity